LNALQVLEDGFGIDRQFVADAEFGRTDATEKFGVERLHDCGVIWLVDGLAVEEVNDRADRVELIGLLRVELEFHIVRKLVTPLALNVWAALVLSWSLPAKPWSRHTTRSGFRAAISLMTSG